jgi:hypothetical protein
MDVLRSSTGQQTLGRSVDFHCRQYFRRFLSAIGIAIIAVAMAGSPGRTDAHLSYDPYLYQYGPSGCSSTPMPDGDWLNIVFSQAQSVSNVAVHINHHLGWRTGLGGSIACFIDHDSLEPQDSTLASHTGVQERWHIRLNKSKHGQDVLAAVHYDECNPYGGEGYLCLTTHDGTNFSGARDKVALAFSQGGHKVSCGGESTPACAEGEVVIISLK